MITIGIDPHKRTHTAVAVSGVGQLLDELTIAAEDAGQRELLDWAHAFEGPEKIRFALEDCRHVNGRLERFLLQSGEQVLRVPPKLMAGARKSARTRGKSDPIDALAIARAALREEAELHPASHDPEARELKLLVDHRDTLVGERTASACRLRWQLHDLEPDLEPLARSLDQASTRRSLSQRLARREQSAQVRICRDLLARIGDLTRRERQLASEIGERVRDYAPELLEVPGVARLSAGKLIGEIAGIERFKSDAQLAHFAGCAPIPASSGTTQRWRFDRHGNRQLNAAFYRIALTQARVHPGARAYLARKRAEGKSSAEALRCLKRLLVRVVWRTLRVSGEQRIALSQSDF
ncbi:MAG TPA: IS110 family transposase [Solirubrobacterales bacterium]|nr:IS110 family transposase [Solirubrobacterales bacterium]